MNAGAWTHRITQGMIAGRESLGPIAGSRASTVSVAPPWKFGVLALAVIVATLVAMSLTQSTFLSQSIIDRESRVVGELAITLAARELSAPDLDRYAERGIQARLERSFAVLKKISGVVRIKVFRKDRTIVWSDEPHLVGSNVTMHHDHFLRALAGETLATFDPPERALWNRTEDLPRAQLIEFYVPLYLGGPSGVRDGPSGVLALYRLPDELNSTIRHSLFLIWALTGAGGAVIYFALMKLVNSVYGRQREAEWQFAALSQEHQRIVQVEKLSSVGQTVSEIAHQINNPLVGVVNLAQLAEREADDPRRVRELLGEIRHAGEQCRDFVRRMLGFSRVARCEPQPTDLRALVLDVVGLFAPNGARRGEVRATLPDRDLTVTLDPVLMRHALFNLIQNAVQACPDAPIEVSVEIDHGESADECRLSVVDHGPGIDPKLTERIFSPFFSTRPDGTGLGLPIAKLVVMWHGGRIHAENNPGGGARFAISLPMKEAQEYGSAASPG